jgi:hypothetical protein
MGRTLHNYNDREDDRKTVKNKFTKPAKHTKNTPGSGMRVINKWSEESIDLDVDDDFDDNAKYFANRK